MFPKISQMFTKRHVFHIAYFILDLDQFHLLASLITLQGAASRAPSIIGVNKPSCCVAEQSVKLCLQKGFKNVNPSLFQTN